MEFWAVEKYSDSAVGPSVTGANSAIVKSIELPKIVRVVKVFDESSTAQASQFSWPV